MTAALQVLGIAKRFAAVDALVNASFHVQAGELLGLIGPNGAGKTTLLECVAGVQSSDAGTVSLGNSALAPSHRKGALFYLPDSVQPWPDERVAWVLEFAEGLFASPAGARSQLIASLQLSPLLGKRVGALSKGERKRLNIALGLLTPQPILLFDEPFDGLDLRQARDVAAVLRAQAAGGRGLCLSIHQLADAVRICDRLVLLAGGVTVGEGTLTELRDKAGVVNGGIEEIFLALT